MAPHLHQLRLLTPVDRRAMTLLVEWWAAAVGAASKLRRDKSFIGKTGQINPNLTAFRQASEMFVKLADRFGLTRRPGRSWSVFWRLPRTKG